MLENSEVLPSVLFGFFRNIQKQLPLNFKSYSEKLVLFLKCEKA